MQNSLAQELQSVFDALLARERLRVCVVLYGLRTSHNSSC
jgi:hypothetical protein